MPLRLVSRRLIGAMPILLTLGIIAQVILLALAILLFVPCLIWPQILNKPYRMIVTTTGKLMIRTVTGRSKTRSEVVTKLVITSLHDTPG